MAKAKEARSKRTSTKTYHNYIGGEWVKSSSGEWFDNVNPADTTDIIGRFPKSVPKTSTAAVEAAKEAATQMASNAGTQTCRTAVHAWRDPACEQGRIHPPDDPRNGQGH